MEWDSIPVRRGTPPGVVPKARVVQPPGPAPQSPASDAVESPLQTSQAAPMTAGGARPGGRKAAVVSGRSLSQYSDAR